MRFSADSLFILPEVKGVRIGHGYDAHRLKKGRRCVLCGVTIPCEFGPDGYSDADVAIHALIDAMLGAAALGDIGLYFPSSEAKWKDADSTLLLKNVYTLVRSQGYKLGNADITIVLEAPRLSQYITHMRKSLADVLSVELNQISVKATTEEGLGFTGSLDGITAAAVVILI